MKRIDCEFEADVLAAAAQGRWPDHVDARLAEHAAHCEICSDVAAVAGAIEAGRDELHSAASIPDSGRMWWIAQMRARREAAKAAGRPITAVQVIALGCAMGLLGACFGATSTWFQSALRNAGAAVAALDLASLTAGHALILVGAGAVLLLVPAAVCVAIFRD